MKENSTDRKSLIAKRKKQFLSLVFGVVLALMPTVEVMAGEVTFNVENGKLTLADGARINADDTLKFLLINTSSGSSIQVVTFEGDTEKETIESGQAANEQPKVRNNGTAIGNCNIALLDHWVVIDTSFDSTYDKAFIKLKAALRNANVNVTCGEGGSSASAGKPQVASTDVNTKVTLSATAKEGYDFDQWTVKKGNIQITAERSANTDFTVGEVYEDIEIEASFKKKDVFTVTFDPNGGTVSPTTKNTDKSGKISEFPTPTWDGHEFTGWFDKKEGGNQVSSSTIFTSSCTVYAHWNEVSPTATPTPTPTPTSRPRMLRHRDSSDSGSSETTSTAVYNYNPDAIDARYYVNGILQSNALIGKQEQSALATAVFAAAVPPGWKRAFSMSMSLNGKNEYSLKNGTIKLTVPAAYQKSGRQFAFLAMDKSGNVVFRQDEDLLPNVVTVSPNLEGYAYVLIYKD